MLETLLAMDPICLWVGRIVVHGSILAATVALGICLPALILKAAWKWVPQYQRFVRDAREYFDAKQNKQAKTKARGPPAERK